MYQIDFLPVGDGERSGDAIAMRYTNPDDPSTEIVGIIDAGFSDNGDALVQHIAAYYGTDAVDFVISTHPDADHINGMGTVMDELKVSNLIIHRPGLHGYPSNSGARPAEELVAKAEAQGAKVFEPFQGLSGFGDSLLIAGPTEAYYEQLLAEQEVTTKAAAAPVRSSALLEAIRTQVQKAISAFPVEIDFGDAGGTNPRNNSAAVVSFVIEGEHFLFPSDAGVAAINPALDCLDAHGRTANWPKLFVLPHHGSRHNLDRATIERILGSHTSTPRGNAMASVSAQTPNAPSPRVANAAGRRGYPVTKTAGQTVCFQSDGLPMRDGWVPVAPLPPLAENDHD